MPVSEINAIVTSLNLALEVNREAITKLMDTRVTATDHSVRSPDLQVNYYQDTPPHIDALSLLNLALRVLGMADIMVHRDADGAVSRFSPAP